MENKRKHLELIQGIISRMAGNSFFLKGWAITLIAALFALSSKDANTQYIFIAYFPVIVFWILDGYFILQERLFRDLYDHVRELSEKEITFSMDTKKYKSKARNSWMASIFSITLLYFYLSLIAIMLIIIYFLH